MMNSLIRSLILIFLIFCPGTFSAQDAFREMDQVYGPDPLLYNGKKYSYFLPHGTGGHQFLISEEYLTGEVTVKGIKFDGVALNYDIYNQQLLLQCANETGASNIIEVSRAWLESFRLDTLEFKYLNFDRDPRFYQVLGDKPCQILYYWRKNLKLSNFSGHANYTFLPPVKTRYVLTGGELHPFSSKSSLIAIFDPMHKLEIKNYMKNNKIKLKQASDQVMTELINFIGNLN